MAVRKGQQQHAGAPVCRWGGQTESVPSHTFEGHAPLDLACYSYSRSVSEG